MKGEKNALVWKVFGGTQRDLLLSLAGLRGSDQVDEDDGGGDFVYMVRRMRMTMSMTMMVMLMS